MAIKLLVEVDDKLPDKTQKMVRESIKLMLGVKSCEDYVEEAPHHQHGEEPETTIQFTPHYGPRPTWPMPDEDFGKIVHSETPKPSFVRRWLGPGLILAVAVTVLILVRV